MVISNPWMNLLSENWLNAPVSYDLYRPPQNIIFWDVPHKIIASDLTHFAYKPPLCYMHFIHLQLPWYIDPEASNPTSISLGNLSQAILVCQQWLIQRADFWNDELSESDQDKISHAWRARCKGDPCEQASGVRRVDFLRRHVVFEGLVKGCNGTWEMKMRKAAY